MKAKVKNFVLRFGGTIAALALMVTVFNVNTCCAFYAYQPEIPESAKKLQKFAE